ncbi:MAG TPA: complex I subunit 5 family protein, partial [Gaiellaceae bacterium]
MSSVLPLPVAIPLLAGALLVTVGHLLPRPAQNAIATLAAAGMTGCSLAILVAAERGYVVHWFGGWHPTGGVALGISFVADPLGAGMAVLVSTLVLLVLVYSWTYTREASHLFDVLMLTFAAAMAGFCLTGDIFNMFVWFELMGVSAYALAAFRIEELGPLQGAVNFAITNTVGAYMILTGIALLYARTGALNLAQIGHELARHRADRLVVVAFTLVVAGLLVKAAIVPFHFWLADAHASAPAPVCALLSGAMVELGIFFVARVYWLVFAPALAPESVAVKTVLLALGVATALLGAFMCFMQRHLKRLLAYSTISHAGLMLAGVALLGTQPLAGVANLVLAHGFLKAGLFLVAGAILIDLGHIDELRLHGAGVGKRVLGTLWFAGTVGLIGLPYVGVYLGHQLLDEGAGEAGVRWLAVVAAIAAGVCGGAMLRAGARIFLGWGSGDDRLLTPEPDETPPRRDAGVGLLTAVCAVTLALGLVASIVPGLVERTELGATRFVDGIAYGLRVLHGTAGPAAARPPFALSPADRASLLYALAALAIALATAAFGLWHERLPKDVRGG